MNASRMRMTIAVLALILALIGQGTSAHKHTLDPDGKDGGTIVKGNGDPVELAHGQNHAPFLPQSDGTYLSCGETRLNPAGYGLETAHHGPDIGTAGRGDTCYQLDDSPLNPETDRNPAIN